MSRQLEHRPIVAILLVVAFLVALLSATVELLHIQLSQNVRSAIYVATGSGLGLAYARSATTRFLRGIKHGSRIVDRSFSFKQIAPLAVFFYLVVYLFFSVLTQLLLGDLVPLISVGNGLLVLLSTLFAIAGYVRLNALRLMIPLCRFFFGILLATGIVFGLYYLDSIFLTANFSTGTLDTIRTLVGPAIVGAILATGVQFLFSALGGVTADELEENRLARAVKLTDEFSRSYREAIAAVTRGFVEMHKDSVRRNPNERTVQITSTEERWGEEDKVEEKTKLTVDPQTAQSGDFRVYSNLLSELENEERYWPRGSEPPDYPDDVDTRRVLEVRIIEKPTPESQTLGDKVRLQLQAIVRILPWND